MAITVSSSNLAGEKNRVIIALAESAAITEVETIKSALLAAFLECDEVLLDVSAVTTADTALLQLIHAARSSSANAGINFVLVGEFSAAFRETTISTGFMAQDTSDTGGTQVLLKE